MGLCKLEIKLLSDTIIGSAEGYGAIVDSDVVYDELGIPYIPAKRVKGILKDSANELISYFRNSGIDYKMDSEKLFGVSGQKEGILKFSNFYIEEYENNIEWLKFYKSKESDYKINITQQKILDTFTSIRTSTTINKDTGSSKKGSLRKFRCINAGNNFYSEIEIEQDLINQIALICQNVRFMGTKRNRGFGSVEISLFEKGICINNKALKEIEGDK